MRRFLTVFIVFSTLAIAQNVVAGTSVSSPAQERVLSAAHASGLQPQFIPSASVVGGETPRASTMMLLATGLAGLTVVGGRRRDQAETVST